MTSVTVKKAAVIALAGIIGLSTGFAFTQIGNADTAKQYCENVESQVREERNISGAIACFEPGIVNVNLSEKVENNSELKCVCRHEYRGIEQIIPISISD